MTETEAGPAKLPENRIPPEIVQAPKAKRVYLLGIGGVAMSAVAAMLKQRGYFVCGSDDQLYPPISDILAQLEVPVQVGFRPENLDPPPDLVIIGNKATRDNVEVGEVLRRGIPFVSMPEAIRHFFLAGKQAVVIAGTHGKTTSTAMVAWILHQSGLSPSFLIGGHSRDFGTNARLGSGPHFVIEGDEYDSAFFDKRPKFVHYEPRSVLLTGVEFDHADIYRDLEQVKDAFRSLIGRIPSQGNLVVCQDFPHAIDVCSARSSRVTFGQSEIADWQIRGLHEHGGHSRFAVFRSNQLVAEVRLRLPGMMNARNAVGALALVVELGIPVGEAVSALEEFRGVARRQEIVGEFDGVLLIDDFAHHPTAVRATLEAIRQRYAGRRLWAVFEPRSNTSRRRVFQREYVRALALADRVIVGGVLRKASDALAEEEMFSPRQLVSDLKSLGLQARTFSSPAVIAVALQRNVRPGDVVVLLSNGDFGGLRAKLVCAWSRKAAKDGSSRACSS